MATWRNWFEAQQQASLMSVTETSLLEAKGWGMQDGGAFYGRNDGAFFLLAGVSIQVGGGQREVVSWQQPMLQETGVGVVVLVKVEGEDLYLVQTKAEPGNDADGCVLLAPTLQASESNLAQAHGGKAPPRADIIVPRLKTTKVVAMRQDGGRLHHKVNKHAMIEVPHSVIGVLNSSERLFTRNELRQALRESACNEHLAQVLAIAFV